MERNPLQELEALGQSVWLDMLNREFLNSGKLEGLIRGDGVSGVTSNPKTFSDSIGGDEYRAEIRALRSEGKGPEEIYETLAVEDVRAAADLLRPVYERAAGADGFVSLEVSPRLAYDASGTIDEARRLWKAVDRPNIFIKVPGVREAVPAIRQLLVEGINVNITLLFSVQRYRDVAEAYLAALEERAAARKGVEKLASVASFFLSRIDVLVDSKLDRIPAGRAPRADSLRGRVAIAFAKSAYAVYQELFRSARFLDLAGRGAATQRLLWASTGAKRAGDSPVKYVEPLIGPDTINTMPLGTLEAYRETGSPARRIEEGMAEARRVIEELTDAGIDPERLAAELEEEGVRKFAKPYDAAVAQLRQGEATRHA